MDLFQRLFHTTQSVIPESVLAGDDPAHAKYLGAYDCGQWFTAHAGVLIHFICVEKPNGTADIRAYSGSDIFGKRVYRHRTLNAALPGLPVQIACFMIGPDACIVGYVDDVAFERAETLWLHTAQPLNCSMLIDPKIASLRKRVFMLPIYAHEIAYWEHVQRAEIITADGMAAERVERMRAAAAQRHADPDAGARFNFSRNYPEPVNPMLNALKLV